MLKHSSIGNGIKPTPLVMVEKKIYLYKMWKAEENIFKEINKKNQTKKKYRKKNTQILDNLFLKKTKDEKKIATAVTLINDVIFIIGAPGTGKTTIILKIIIALIKSNEYPIKIQLSAFTGKATENLNNVLNNDIFNIYLSEKEKKCLPSNAKTIHQLLKINKISQRSALKKENLLDADIIIIDEVSMIDILMMEKILFSVRKQTKLIFLGDKHQLTPINSASFLENIYNHVYDGYSISQISHLQKLTKYKIINKINKKNTDTISNGICLLKKNYRFDQNSGIYHLSTAILKNKKIVIKNTIKNNIKNIFFYNLNTHKEYKKMINIIIERNKNFLNLVNQNKKVPHIIKSFQKHQVLCILRYGIFGVNFLNKKLEETMCQLKIIKKYHIIKKEYWYTGKPIIVTKNNPFLNIFNGNIGITTVNKNKKIIISFLKENDQVYEIPINILENYETAWSITIHKAQGSEFENTTLVIPNFYTPIIKKDVLYTGITRSKKKLNIFSTKKIFLKTLLNKTIN